MPELPEIETVKLQLSKVLVGQKLLASDFPEVTGKTVQAVKRLGKVLLISFGEGFDLGFHFKMTGQLIYDDGHKRIAGGHPSEDFVAALPNTHTRSIFVFEKGKLFFNDMRKFGWIQLNPKFVDKLGPEPFNITPEDFVTRLQKSKKPIKVAIMDQEIISGVGNIYANDALWEAEINPQIVSSKLSKQQLELLLEKIVLVLQDGIKYGGASYSDYVQPSGEGGHYQDHFRTYNRDGQPCFRCKTLLKKTVIGGRGTFYCPVCQK